MKLATVSVALHGDSNRPSEPHPEFEGGLRLEMRPDNPGAASPTEHARKARCNPQLVVSTGVLSVRAVLELHDKSLRPMS